MRAKTSLIIIITLLLSSFFLVSCGGGGGDDDDDSGGSSGDDDDDDDDDNDDDNDDNDDNDNDDNDDDDTVGPGLMWISIPGGSYWMGCSIDDAECDSNETPRHSVSISAFYMTETEITQQQYQEVTGQNPSYFNGCPNCPVEQVTWFNARDFCEAVGGRLPTEAEWEYAARAGTDTKWICGNDASCLDSIAWYEANSNNETHPVGQLDPNSFGLYDMSGNVWEWVNDWFGQLYYYSSPGSNPQGPANTGYRVMRGSSYNYYGGYFLRASYRSWGLPESAGTGIGFRCFLDLSDDDDDDDNDDDDGFLQRSDHQY